MKLLYGVVGEGMGHATRSRVVLEHLLADGHEVEIMASSRAADFLSARFPEVHRIHGLHIVTDDNRVKKSRTFFSNLLKGVASLPGQMEAYFRMLEDFHPQAVISDFESWSYLFAKAHNLPVFSIDNMQVINRCKIPEELLEGERVDYELARAFIQGKLPGCDHYFITTFFHPPIDRKRTSLHYPILRPEVLEAKVEHGDHLLVYQTAEGHDELADMLRGTGLECRIYGMRREITEEQQEGRLRFMPFSEAGFIRDLATAKAVVSGGGFTLMSEAVTLHKPMLSVPIEDHFEQLLNGRYLQYMGFGRHAEEVDAGALGAFMEALPDCEAALEAYRHDGNKGLFDAINEHLDLTAVGYY